MADDKQAIVGKWRVKFKHWTWEYEFFADGRVTWIDPLNKLRGSGRWALTPNTVYLNWAPSTVKESWERPVKNSDYRGYIDADYGKGQCHIERIEVDTTDLLPPEFAAKPYQTDFMTQAAVQFATGFAEGLDSRLSDKQLATVLIDKILADKFAFYQGYVTGVIVGLVGGLVDLLKLIVTLAGIAQAVSVPNILKSLLKEGYLLLTDKAYVETRKAQLEQAKRIAEAVAGVIVEIQSKPSLYVSSSYTAGVGLGRELAGYVEAKIKNDTAAEIGKWFGTIVGRVLFEVIVFLILSAATGGTGEGARVGMAMGEAAQGATKYARLMKWITESLEEMPAIRKLISTVLGRPKGALRVEEIVVDAATQARWATRGSRLRLPARSGSSSVGELWGEGAAEAQQFAGRSGSRGLQAPRTDLTQPPRHVMKPGELADDLNKGIPEHLKDLSPAEKRQWIESAEGKKWRETQRLDGPTNNLETEPPHAGPRDHDAEANMFEELLSRTDKDSIGEFHFKVDRPVCPACKDMIFRFRGQRPGIKVVQHSPDNKIIR